jgi:hypothetical protein
MKKYKKIKILTFLFIGVFFVFSAFNFVDASPATISLENPLTYDTIDELIEAVINFITMVAFAIAPIIFIWGGMKFYFAGGDPNKVKEATALIKWAVVGLTIVIVANGIIYVIQDVIGYGP